MSPPISLIVNTKHIAILLVSIFILSSLSTLTIAEDNVGRRAREKRIDLMWYKDVAPQGGYWQGGNGIPMLLVRIQSRQTKENINFINVTHIGNGDHNDIGKITIYENTNDDSWFQAGLIDLKRAKQTTWHTNGYMQINFTPEYAVDTEGIGLWFTCDFKGTAMGTHGIMIRTVDDIDGPNIYISDPYKNFPVRSSMIGINLTSYYNFKIKWIETYDNFGTKMNDFYSDFKMKIRCNLTHTWGSEYITAATITIYDPTNKRVVNYQPMTKMFKDGVLWEQYQYDYYIPNPSARGVYIINITGTGKGYMGQSTYNYSTYTFNVLNYLPEIQEPIPNQLKKEDEVWELDLLSYKSDFEDPDEDLTWWITSIEHPLESVDVDGNTLTFHPLKNKYGNDKVELHLKDSDDGEDWTYFWINITSDNDPPEIHPPIPNQEKVEDDDDWTVTLTPHMDDVEDPPAKLIWSVWDVNENLYSVNVDGNFLKFSLVPDAYGKDIMMLNLTDTEGLTATQEVWVNVTGVNDPPQWLPIGSIIVQKMEVKDVIHLEKYIEDIDTAKHKIEFKIESNDNPTRFNVSIDNNSYIDVSLIIEGYTGFANIEVSANDGTTTVNQTLKIFATLEEMATSLRTPPDGAKLSTKSPQLSWSTNIPAEFEDYRIAYNLYFSKDKTQVEAQNPDVILEEFWTSESFFPRSSLTNGSTYYWTVIPLLMAKSGEVLLKGECIDEVWKFMIDLSAPNEPPSVYLLTPENQAVLKEYSVELSWEGYDPNGDSPLFYDLFFGTDKDLVSAHDETVKVELSSWTAISHKITNLTEDTIYYWTILPSDGKKDGTCLDDVWEFGINVMNSPPVVTLQYPLDNDFVGYTPELYWTCEDPDPLENFRYFLYINEDDKKVLSLDEMVLYRGRSFHQNYMKISPALEIDTTYYWIVIPQDGSGRGRCDSGIWSFTTTNEPGSSNYLPKVNLLYPDEGAIIPTTEVELQWQGSDDNQEDQLSYSIYFSTDRQLVEKYDLSALFDTVSDTNSFEIGYLENGTTYYWAVIPNDGKSNGVCLNKYWYFRIDITKEDPELKGKFDPTNITKIRDQSFFNEFRDIIIGAIIIAIIALLISALVIGRGKKKPEKKDEDTQEERVESKEESKPKPTSISTKKPPPVVNKGPEPSIPKKSEGNVKIATKPTQPPPNPKPQPTSPLPMAKPIPKPAVQKAQPVPEKPSIDKK